MGVVSNDETFFQRHDGSAKCTQSGMIFRSNRVFFPSRRQMQENEMLTWRGAGKLLTESLGCDCFRPGFHEQSPGSDGPALRLNLKQHAVRHHWRTLASINVGRIHCGRAIPFVALGQ